MLTLLFFRLDSFFEKNQYVYIVRSVNGKDFQLFPAQKFSSLALSLSLCVWLQEKISLNFFPFSLVLNDNWLSERLKWQARKLRVSLRSSFSQEMILFLRGEKVPSTNNFIRFSDFHFFFSRGRVARFCRTFSHILPTVLENFQF